jgi:hypothetical protein
MTNHREYPMVSGQLGKYIYIGQHRKFTAKQLRVILHIEK